MALAMWLPARKANHYLSAAVVATVLHHELVMVELIHHHGAKWPAKLSSLAHLSYSSLKASSCITFTVSPAFKREVPDGTTINASAVPKPVNG